MLLGSRMSRSRGKRARRLTLLAALGISIAATFAGVSGAEDRSSANNGEATFDAAFAPKVLSKTRPTPIALTVSWRSPAFDGPHPPPLSELTFDTDRNLAIDLKGFPVCKPQVQHEGFSDGEPICKSAQIGRGRIDVSIALPEAGEIQLSSTLRVFNGPKENGVRTLYLHALINRPVPSMIVMTAKIRTLHKGRYGAETVLSLPRIAGGSGSVTSFSATIDRKYAYRGRRVSVVTLKCPGGKIVAHGEALFSDGSRTQEELARACTAQN
jgi:hypothetical protein